MTTCPNVAAYWHSVWGKLKTRACVHVFFFPFSLYRMWCVSCSADLTSSTLTPSFIGTWSQTMCLWAVEGRSRLQTSVWPGYIHTISPSPHVYGAQIDIHRIKWCASELLHVKYLYLCVCVCVGRDSVVQGSRGPPAVQLHVFSGYVEYWVHLCRALSVKVRTKQRHFIQWMSSHNLTYTTVLKFGVWS